MAQEHCSRHGYFYPNFNCPGCSKEFSSINSFTFEDMRAKLADYEQRIQRLEGLHVYEIAGQDAHKGGNKE